MRVTIPLCRGRNFDGRIAFFRRTPTSKESLCRVFATSRSPESWRVWTSHRLPSPAPPTSSSSRIRPSPSYAASRSSEKGHPQFILCSAAGIPKPKHGCIGDPGFVSHLGTRQSAEALPQSQDSFVPGKFVTLKAGSKWSRANVTCKLATKGKTVTCKNLSGHGFTIGNKKYKPF